MVEAPHFVVSFGCIASVSTQRQHTSTGTLAIRKSRRMFDVPLVKCIPLLALTGLSSLSLFLSLPCFLDSPVCLLAHLLTRLLNHPLAHLLTHSLTHSHPFIIIAGRAQGS